jgi:uncharacterized protein YecE (DUF72 family)
MAYPFRSAIRVSEKRSKAPMPKEYIGTAGWSIPRRVANQFPAEDSALVRYAARFSAAEINSTSHRPARDLRPLGGFRRGGISFRCKVSKSNKSWPAASRCGNASKYVPRGDPEPRQQDGAILTAASAIFDLPSAGGGKVLRILRKCSWQRVVCEPRHPSWFDADVDNLLASFDVARVAADPARVPEAGRPGGTRTFEYYRLHGTPRMYYSAYDSSFLSKLANSISQSRAEEVWCIFDNTVSGAAAENALEIQMCLDRYH